MDLTRTIAEIPIEKHESGNNAAIRDLPRIISAASKLNPVRWDNYKDWFDIACALKSASDDLFWLFDALSRQAANYGGTRRLWDSIQPREGGITIGSLYYWAEQDAKLKQPKPTDAKLEPICSGELPRLYAEAPRPIIKGRLNVGDVENIIGGPKTNKTSFVMQMAISVAAGVPFLGFDTYPDRVLIVDNELRPNVFWRRLKAMVEAMGLDWEAVTDNLDVLLLRGRLAGLHEILDMVQGSAGRYSLVVVDALYKTLRSIDENSNSDIAAVYCLIDNAAEKSQSAFGIVHHTSKGNQSGKSISDIGSGAGAQSRSADVHTVILPHEEEGYFVLGTIARAQPPIKPMVLKFDWPIWSLAPDKAPTVAAARKKPEPSIDDFLATIPNEPALKTETLKHSKLKLLCSRNMLMALVGQCQNDKLIEIIAPKNKKEKQMIRRISEPKNVAA